MEKQKIDTTNVQYGLVVICHWCDDKFPENISSHNFDSYGEAIEFFRNSISDMIDEDGLYKCQCQDFTSLEEVVDHFKKKKSFYTHPLNYYLIDNGEALGVDKNGHS